jgi:hypothetical protein
LSDIHALTVTSSVLNLARGGDARSTADACAGFVQLIRITTTAFCQRLATFFYRFGTRTRFVNPSHRRRALARFNAARITRKCLSRDPLTTQTPAARDNPLSYFMTLARALFLGEHSHFGF